MEEFSKLGFLPEALLNYLALLGWSTSDSQQLFDPANHFDELVQKFELERCQKSPAIFDFEKLRWMNGMYIRKLSQNDLIDRAWPYLKNAGLVTESSDKDLRDYIHRALLLEQEKFQVLSDAPGLIDFFLEEKVKLTPEAVEKVLKKPEGHVKVPRRDPIHVGTHPAELPLEELHLCAKRIGDVECDESPHGKPTGETPRGWNPRCGRKRKTRKSA